LNRKRLIIITVSLVLAVFVFGKIDKVNNHVRLYYEQKGTMLDDDKMMEGSTKEEQAIARSIIKEDTTVIFWYKVVFPLLDELIVVALAAVLAILSLSFLQMMIKQILPDILINITIIIFFLLAVYLKNMTDYFLLFISLLSLFILSKYLYKLINSEE
jgi:hypothetical protein